MTPQLCQLCVLKITPPQPSWLMLRYQLSSRLCLRVCWCVSIHHSDGNNILSAPQSVCVNGRHHREPVHLFNQSLTSEELTPVCFLWPLEGNEAANLRTGLDCGWDDLWPFRCFISVRGQTYTNSFYHSHATYLRSLSQSQAAVCHVDFKQTIWMCNKYNMIWALFFYINYVENFMNRLWKDCPVAKLLLCSVVVLWFQQILAIFHPFIQRWNKEML